MIKLLSKIVALLIAFTSWDIFAQCSINSTDTNYKINPEYLNITWNMGVHGPERTLDIDHQLYFYLPPGVKGTYRIIYMVQVGRNGQNSMGDVYYNHNTTSRPFTVTANENGLVFMDEPLTWRIPIEAADSNPMVSVDFILQGPAYPSDGLTWLSTSFFRDLVMPNTHAVKSQDTFKYNVNDAGFFGCTQGFNQLVQFDFPASSQAFRADGFGYEKVDGQWLQLSAMPVVMEKVTGFSPSMHFQTLKVSTTKESFDANRILKLEGKIISGWQEKTKAGFISNSTKPWLYEFSN